MSNKSGTSDQVISLPKGGGALSGIGETFSPDLHTGTGNFTVPIALPPGRNGFQPELNLVYSTGNGNGPFGLGWSLSVPGVSRKTSQGVPRYQDGATDPEGCDTFLLSGAEDLVPVPGGPDGAIRYRPRTEGLFACIERHLDADNDYWQVRSKDGLVSLYGTPASRGIDPAVIADPDKRRRVFAWKLTETRDPFGNRIVYEYERDCDQTPEDPPQHRWDQLYLKRIRYVDYTDEGGQEQFLVSITFEYEELPDRYEDDVPDVRRIYPFSDYRASFEIRTRRRCTRIVIRTHADADRLVRTYGLVYLDQRNDLENVAQLLPLNGVSLLSQVRVVGHDESQPNPQDRTEELPPLEFGYSRFEPKGRDFFPFEGRDLPARSLASPDLELADLFGNGLPDILEMNGRARYWRNLGGGRFDLPRQMQYAPAGLSLADPGVQMVDANGNGRIDLLVTANSGNGLSGYFPLRFGGLWDRRSFQPYDTAPSFNLEGPEVKLVDLTGNGVTDAIRSGTRLECAFNHPKEGWHRIEPLERQALEAFPNVTFADPRVKWGDMSGDGLQDIVLVYDGNVEYWPNLGHGNWTRRIHMENSPRFPYGYDPQRILVGDVDGDGLADIVYVEDTKVTLWINQSGNGWSDPIEIDGTPPVSNTDAVRMADMLGTGIGGVLWTSDRRTASRANLFFLDFTGGTKPYLLNEMDNHMGAVTRVEYEPATRFYLDDEERRETRWQTPLPFPVQVVSRVEVIDHISEGKLTTEYTYHHGYWDGAEREFRGFGRVDQRDTEVFEDYHASGLHTQRRRFAPVPIRSFSPPTETRTWFHQGPIGDEFGEWTESDYGTEFWSGDPQMLQRPSEMIGFLKGLDRRVKRDALRALRGCIIRTELYALDGSGRKDRPYTVTEYLHAVTSMPVGTPWPDHPEDWQKRVFFPHTLAQRTTQWERGDDPMTQFTFTDDYDAFGQPRQQTAVALPRRSAKRVPAVGAIIGLVDVNETRILATHTRTTYAVPDTGHYIHDRVAQVRTFELKQPPPVAESDPPDLIQVLRDQSVAARTVRQSFRDLLKGWSAGNPLPTRLRLIGHTLNYYDGQGFEGRAVGEVGPYGALTRSEALVFTDDELDAAYGTRRPTYLGGNASAPAGAPSGFGSSLGYHQKQASPAGYHAGYYADTQRRQFDFQDSNLGQGRGIVVAMEDALGHRTTVVPDRLYWLLPQRVVDPVKLETRAEYDYRVLQPRQVTDPNEKSTHLRYTPMGLLHKQFLEGGTEEKPETEYTYDFWAYECTRDQEESQPISVHTRQRVYHANDSISDETIESREYSDGFGRLVQTRAQAEDLIFGESGDAVGLPLEPGSQPGPAVGRPVADSVVVSGWQVYDNKGQVIEKYEPCFASGWAYQRGPFAPCDKKVAMYYDPRGQVIRTVNPDGSEQWVIYGVPGTVAHPDPSSLDAFEPTPWESYTYDPNDLAPLSVYTPPDGSPPQSLDGRTPATHHYTPASGLLDGLGRVICQVERNGPDPAEHCHITRSEYDVRGNLLTVYDALGRAAFTYQYDLLSNPLAIDSVDAGQRTSVLDAVGNLVEYRDSEGSIVLRVYDESNRLKELWARDDHRNPNAPVTLREKLVYGDDLAQTEMTLSAAQQKNLRGKPYQYYDEAGLLTFARYDYKGNLVDKTRQVISDAALANDWTANWSAPNAHQALDSTIYQTTTEYDALNRPTKVVYPADVNGHCAELIPTYDRAGALESVKLAGDTYVQHIAYNAKGQRVLIAYGNRIMTRYVYDPCTFRLIRLRSEGYQHSTDNSETRWTGSGNPLQDYAYTYDLVGNITGMDERVPNCGIVNSPHGRHRLVRQFQYDPLYRLTQADGRACKDIGVPRPLADLARCGAYAAPYTGGSPTPNQNNAPHLTESYTETYKYDPAGNMLELRYMAGSGRWTRRFGMGGLLPDQWVQAPNNRLTSLVNGNQPATTFGFDDNGNMISQNTERTYTWDHADRLTGFTIQAGSRPSVEVRYLYGADGMRVKKWVRTNGTGGGESTVYVDNIFEHHRWKESGVAKENNHLHVMDGLDQPEGENLRRIALLSRGDAHPKDGGPDVQYHVGDHLGSSSVVIGQSGIWVNREEYTPYGETSFGSFARKRYRFTGKEHDEESDLYYYGARYYALAFARWVSCDPLADRESLNPYQHSRSNPVYYRDYTGLQARGADSFEIDIDNIGSREDLDKVETFEQSGRSGFDFHGVGQAPENAAEFVVRFADDPSQGTVTWDPTEFGETEPFLLSGNRYKFSLPGGTEAEYLPVRGDKLLGRPFDAPTDVGAHSGQDIHRSLGESVFSVFSGKVVYKVTGTIQYEKPGNQIWIQNQEGLIAIYLHVKPSEDLFVGTEVAAGQKVGQIDLSGLTIFPHLHFSLGRAMRTETGGIELQVTDPLPFLKAGRRIPEPK
jgi:RHS repeat-associated protein